MSLLQTWDKTHPRQNKFSSSFYREGNVEVKWKTEEKKALINKTDNRIWSFVVIKMNIERIILLTQM